MQLLVWKEFRHHFFLNIFLVAHNCFLTVPLLCDALGGLRSVAADQLAHSIETTSIQRPDVESTLNRRCFNVV